MAQNLNISKVKTTLVVSDVLSRLDISDNQEIFNISEICGYNDDDLPDGSYPIHYHDISKAQKTGAKKKAGIT